MIASDAYPTDDPSLDDGAIDAFTAWILDWQHFILPCLALVFIASLITKF